MLTRPCRSCGALIGFLELPSGRRMPVDPELVKASVVVQKTWRPGERMVTLITEAGVCVRGLEAAATHPRAVEVAGHVPHFITCDDPARFRQRRQGKPPG